MQLPRIVPWVIALAGLGNGNARAQAFTFVREIALSHKVEAGFYDARRDRIGVFSPAGAGTFLTRDGIPIGPATATGVGFLDGAAYDAATDRVLFLDQACTLVEADPDTLVPLTTTPLALGASVCAGVAIGADGNLYIASWGNAKLIVATRDGAALVRTIDLGALGFGGVDGVTLYPGSENLLVASSSADYTMVIDPMGTVVEPIAAITTAPLVGGAVVGRMDGLTSLCATGHVWICTADGAACFDYAPDGGEKNTCVCSTPCTAIDDCHVAGACSLASGECSNPIAPDGRACDDESACTSGDACLAGACTPAETVTCAPPDQCHQAGLCDSLTGGCGYEPVADGTACDDRDACTMGEACTAGACTPPIEGGGCPAPDSCHRPGTCDPTTGACEYDEVADGTACDDGDACTSGEACHAGICGDPFEMVSCGSADSCHRPGTCDPTTGACEFDEVADGTACDDSDACTAGEACYAGICGGPIETVTCRSPDECHATGTCDPATAECLFASLPDGTFCPNGSCIGGECQPSSPDAGVRDAGLPNGATSDAGSESGGTPAGCDCRAAGRSRSGCGGAILAAALGLWTTRRRRR